MSSIDMGGNNSLEMIMGMIDVETSQEQEDTILPLNGRSNQPENQLSVIKDQMESLEHTFANKVSLHGDSFSLQEMLA